MKRNIFCFNVKYLFKKLLQVRKCELDCLLSDMWKESVTWNIKTDRKSTLQQEIDASSIEEVSLSVNFKDDSNSELRDLVRGLHKQKLLNSQMKLFADRFKKFIVPLIVEYPILDIDVTTSGPTKTLVITNKKETAEKAIDKAYVSVFSNLIYVMTELSSMLLSSEFDREETSSMDQRDTLMSWLGEEVGTWLLDLLQRNVIAKAVPTSSKDLVGFQDVIKHVTVVHGKRI